MSGGRATEGLTIVPGCLVLAPKSSSCFVELLHADDLRLLVFFACRCRPKEGRRAAYLCQLPQERHHAADSDPPSSRTGRRPGLVPSVVAAHIFFFSHILCWSGWRKPPSSKSQCAREHEADDMGTSCVFFLLWQSLGILLPSTQSHRSIIEQIKTEQSIQERQQ